jgi:hypothetical protein
VSSSDALWDWLVRNELAGPGYALATKTDPVLASRLQRQAFAGAATTASRMASLVEIEERFSEAEIPLVRLKGAAVASWAYADPSLRSMSDLDLWVRTDDMERAGSALVASGYRPDGEGELDHSAPARGPGREWTFRRDGRRGDVVELHDSPFRGWWTFRAASPDAESTWRRAVRAGPSRHARRLSAEDAVLQIAVHSVVNRLSQAPMRALLDLAVISRAGSLTWNVLTKRAIASRLRCATWFVLDLADRLFRLDDAASAISALRPSGGRRMLFRGFLPLGSFLRNPRSAWVRRHGILLVASDDLRGGARLLGRTLWPEDWWMEARYGSGASRSGHLRELLRRREA